MIIEFYKTNEWCTDFENPSFTDQEWSEWDRAYADYFDTVVDKLPKGFMRQYYSNKGFHDFILTDICIHNRNLNKITTEILLDSDYSGLGRSNKKYLLTYRNVESYNISVLEDKRWSFGNMQWLSDEFYLREDGLWSHRIMCDGNCEIKLVFKKISIKKV